MATSDPYNFAQPQYDPNYVAPPRQRGCFFYGCLFASVAAFLMLVAVSALMYLAFRYFGQLVQEYSATEPVALPKVEISEQDYRTLDERVTAFRKALDEGTPTAPLVLSSADLNALIEATPALRNKIFVTIEDDKIKGKISIPLEDFAVWPFENMFKGRFLNGEAELKVSLENERLLVLIDSIEVNGKSPPPDALDQLRQQNLTRDAYKDPRNAEQIRKIESIQVKEGKVIITARGSRPPQATPANLPDEVIAPLDPKTPEKPPAPPAAEPNPKSSNTDTPNPK